MNEVVAITTDKIADLIASAVQGEFSILEVDEEIIVVKHEDTGLIVTSALDGNVLFSSVLLAEVNEVPEGAKDAMLDAGNGIATSSFKLQKGEEGIMVTLQNFAKLLELGTDDQDDIVFCFESIVADTIEAQNLLGEFFE